VKESPRKEPPKKESPRKVESPTKTGKPAASPTKTPPIDLEDTPKKVIEWFHCIVFPVFLIILIGF
jgi:hypothetical protein